MKCSLHRRVLPVPLPTLSASSTRLHFSVIPAQAGNPESVRRESNHSEVVLRINRVFIDETVLHELLMVLLYPCLPWLSRNYSGFCG